MNPNTGAIYRTELDRIAAEMRGEPLVEVSERVANAVEVGMVTLNRRERRAAAARERRGPKPKRKRRRS